MYDEYGQLKLYVVVESVGIETEINCFVEFPLRVER